jgi:hypothetical protein
MVAISLVGDRQIDLVEAAVAALVAADQSADLDSQLFLFG